MTNQDQNKEKVTKKGDPSWDQHNKDNAENAEKQQNTGCGCGCGCGDNR